MGTMFGLHSALFLSSASHAVDALAKGANKTGNFRSDHQWPKLKVLEEEIGIGSEKLSDAWCKRRYPNWELPF